MELKPGYKQTEVGVIPEEWEVCKLSELLTAGPKNGYSGCCNADERGTPTLSLSATSSGQLVLGKETIKFLEETIKPGSDIFLLNGDVLVQRANTAELVGTTAIFDGPSKVYAYPDLMMRLRFRDAETARWFWRYANSRQGKRYFAAVASGSTGSMPKISASMLRQMLVPLPPLNEQRAVIETLDEIDEFTASLNRLIAKKRDIKQAAMQELLTGKRRLPGFEGEWEEFSLGSVASMNSGGTPPTGRDDYYGGGIPWVSISDMTSGGKFISQTERTLSAAGLANCAAKQFPAGTILYAMYASLGECSIAATEVTSSQAILGIRPGASLHNEFLFYYLSSIHDKVKLMGQQGTQSNLNKGIVQGFTLRLPDKAEQIAIAEALGDIDQELDALSMKAQKIREMKAGMMQQLLTGKIRLT